MKSAKFSWWNYTLWPFLRIIWEPFSKKRSYFWHWQPYSGEVTCYHWIIVKNDGSIKDRLSRWDNFWQTNFGWRRTMVFSPLKKDRQRFHGKYHIGFTNEITGQNEICWLELSGHVAVLTGNADVRFFAVDAADLTSIELKSHGEVLKNGLKVPLI